MTTLCVICAVCLAHLVWVGKAHPQDSERVEPVFEEVLVIGDDESKPAEYLSGDPRFVVTDRAGNIYVADQASREIRMFDPEGTFRAVIGGPGQAPGEFEALSAMTINGDEEIVVYDTRQRRFTRFDTNGEVLQTTTVSSLWPNRLQSIKLEDRNVYIAVSIAPQYEDHGRHIFHVFDGELRRRRSFGRVEDVFGQTGSFENMMLSVHPGEFSVTSSGDIIYAPGIYDGRLFRYSHVSGLEWEEAIEIRGHARSEKAFEVFDADDFDEATMVRGIQINPDDGTREETVGRVLSTSAGLFERGDSSIVHFTFSTEDAETAVMGLEIFDAEGTLVSHGRFDRVVRYSPMLPTLQVMWRDDHDRFYLVDRNDAPVIRVVKVVTGHE